MLLHELFVLEGDRLDVVLQIDFLFELVLQALLETVDFLQVDLQLRALRLQRRRLPLQLPRFPLHLEHDLLQLAAVVVELAALALEGMRFLADLDDGGLEGTDFVAEQPLRLLLLLGKLTLERRHSPLVAQVILDNRPSHGVKRECRPPRYIMSIHT